MVILVMGVSGSGKTTVGQKLAAELNWSFFDGDDYHQPENVEKMSRGIPLTDEDRHAWLLRLRGLIADLHTQAENGIIACSALKASYRQILMGDDEDVVLVYLKGNYELIWERMQTRHDHYMKADMLRSQFEALEVPHDAITLDITLSPDEIVTRILSQLPPINKR